MPLTRREWSPGSQRRLFPALPPFLSLAERHGAGSRKAALKTPSMPLYGNDRMRRHIPFVLRLCAVSVRALPLEAGAAHCTGSESAARSRGVKEAGGRRRVSFER